MKTDIETLKETFKTSYALFENSYNEAKEVIDMFHNRQFTESQLAKLKLRGQPAETFNVIKMFSRLLVGYYSTIINTIVAKPVHYSSTTKAVLMTDVIQSILEKNKFELLGDQIKLSALLTGLPAVFVNVEETGESDKWGRPIRNVTLDYVPYNQLVLDYTSVKPDYSDARYIHRFKWIHKDGVRKIFGNKILNKLEANVNYLNEDISDVDFNYDGVFSGYFRSDDLYLIVHTCIENDKGEVESIYWCDEVEIARKPFKLKGVKFPYVVNRINHSDKAEFYGIFREVVESQKAINQAIIKIQLMVNTQKVFVEEAALGQLNLEEFTDMLNRVNSVIPVTKLTGVRVENLTQEVIDQYNIIDKALERIKRVLNINDSFLGMAYASDSGRKVKLQRNSSIIALRYVTSKLEDFYSNLGKIIAEYVKNYYTAEQMLRVTDEITGERWVQINKPLEMPEINEKGEVEYKPVLEEVIDPETGKPLINKGKYVLAPVPDPDTDLMFENFDFKVVSSSFDNEDEENRILLETVLSGNVGQMLAKVNPAGYFKVVGLSLRNIKTRFSPEISSILEETSNMLSQNQQKQEQAKIAAMGRVKDNPKSQEAQLPESYK